MTWFWDLLNALCAAGWFGSMIAIILFVFWIVFWVYVIFIPFEISRMESDMRAIKEMLKKSVDEQKWR